MSRFDIEQKQKSRAVQWRGDNLEEIHEFLADIPKVTDDAEAFINPDAPEFLNIYGYDCVEGLETELRQGAWLVLTFSVMHDDIRLTKLPPELFVEMFTVAGTPGLVRPTSTQHRVYMADGCVYVADPEPRNGCISCALAELGCEGKWPGGGYMFPCSACDREDSTACVWKLSMERWK